MKQRIKNIFLFTFVSIALFYTFKFYIYVIDKKYKYVLKNRTYLAVNDLAITYLTENSDELIVNEIEQVEIEEIVENVENVIEEEPQILSAPLQEEAAPPPVINTESNDLRSNIVSFASQFVGNSYVWGGNSLTNGTDCSGFVMLVYQNFGVSLPRTTDTQAQSGVGVSLSEILPGDIVSYGYNGVPSHSALYIGNDTIVHAANPRDGIMYSNIYIMPIITIRRVI